MNDCESCKWGYDNRKENGSALLYEMHEKFQGDDPCGFCVHTAVDNFEPIKETKQ